MTYKKLMGQTPFRLVYGHVDVIHIEYIIPNLRIITITEMTYVSVVKEILSQLIQMEEYHFVEGYHQNVEKK